MASAKRTLPGKWGAILRGMALSILAMSFSYTAGANPTIDYIRLLISDTKDTAAEPHIFEDSEILSFIAISSNVWQSSQQFSGLGGTATLPSNPVNYLRAAALALDSLASNNARLANVMQILDVRLSANLAAQQLRTQAKEYRLIDDESMAFVIIEQCNNEWSFIDRFWRQWQRQAI